MLPVNLNPMLVALYNLLAWLGTSFSGTDTFVDIYVKSLRGSLFTGFITLGSFVTAAMNYTLSTLKSGVYETTEYKAMAEKVKAAGGNADMYAPLKRLGNALFAVIVASFLTSMLQLTVGLIPYNWAALICVGGSVITMIIVVIALVVMGMNLNVWKEHLPSNLPGGPSAPATRKPTALFRPRSEHPSK